MASTAGGSVNDFRKMGKSSMEAGLSIAAGDTSVGDAVGKIGDVITAKGKQMDIDYKAIYKEKQDAVDTFAKDIERTFIDMAPEAKELGQESYQQAQNDVYGLREELINCGGDQRCVANVYVKLNEAKTRHGTDSENHKGLNNLMMGEEDENGIRGESSADVKAMTEEGRQAMKEFGSNKTKRIKYLDETGTKPGNILNYEWDIPNPKYISDEETPNENPVITQIYSNSDLQDMVAIKETANGDKLQDFIQAEKEKKGNNQSVSDNAALKKSVGDMIPKTQQAIKSWAYSNPAEQDYLDVYKYLSQHEAFNSSYAKMGIVDQQEPGEEGYGVLNWDDLVDGQDKEAMIQAIMNGDDVNLSHEILTDIYASCAGNEISGAGNTDHNPGRNELSGIKTEYPEQLKQERKEFYDMLATDEGKQTLNNMTKNEVIEKYKLTDDEVKNGVIVDGKTINIDSFIAGPTKKKTSEEKEKGALN
jgi:hypothetical protein